MVPEKEKEKERWTYLGQLHCVQKFPRHSLPLFEEDHPVNNLCLLEFKIKN